LAEIHFPLISQIECARINAEKIQTMKDTAEAPSVRAPLHLTFYIGNLALGSWHAFTISRSTKIDDHRHATPLGLVVQRLVIWLLTFCLAGAGATNRNSLWLSCLQRISRKSEMHYIGENQREVHNSLSPHGDTGIRPPALSSGGLHRYDGSS
jgi:hypothetical protein